MKNIFFIDGPQMSGKSTLIEFLEKSTNGPRSMKIFWFEFIFSRRERIAKSFPI